MKPVARAWHADSLEVVLSALDTSIDGLTTEQARRRLLENGANAVPTGKRIAAWRVLVGQLRSIVVALLVVSVVIAAATHDAIDAMAIGAILILNVALGFAVEIRAHRAVESLSRLEPRRAVVLRERTPVEIDARDVVPGDVLILEAGQTIAADARLLSGAELRTNESALTGESMPVTKYAEAIVDARTSLPDRRNMLFAGTAVVDGAGRAVVVCTGASTELGVIGQLVIETTEAQTPLERRLDTLGRQLVWIAGGAGLMMAGIGSWYGAAPTVMIQTGLALAVAAVPEGLPVVATMALALGVHRMARRHALVRRLPAVEALGSVTVICTDKTGTLTAGTMSVTTIVAGEVEFVVEGTGYAREGRIVAQAHPEQKASHPALTLALKIAALANHASLVMVRDEWIARGDPTEAALLVAASKGGVDGDALRAGLTEVGEIPFSSERKWMAMFYRDHAGAEVGYLKGAPDRVLDLCTRILTAFGDRPLDAARRAVVRARNDEMAKQGMRVLALAYGTTDNWRGGLPDLTYVGLVGMIDPPAPHVRETVTRFRAAGIRTVMLTGDQRLTAEAIARDLGLETTSGTPDAATLEQMPDEAFDAVIEHAAVFSRVSPALKLRIVDAFQRRGDTVAMIGDGVNDAAALKKADVGVTMGRRGTDVARETAAVVLTDDRFETIGVAIEQGRVIFDNIRKFVFYLFSCNLAEIFVLCGAAVVGAPVPLKPVQILWLNLVTDTLPALSLVLEPSEPNVMQRPPRPPAAGLLSRRFGRSVTRYAALIAASTFIVIIIANLRGRDATYVATLAFTTLGLAQVFHLGNARSRGPVLSLRRASANAAAIAAVISTCALLGAAIYWSPLATVLEAVPLSVMDWQLVIVASAVPAVIGQTLKWRAS